MTGACMALVLAAFFTFGCISIYEGREHAKAMTPPLALAAACFGVFVGLLAMTEQPENPGGEAVAHAAVVRRAR